MIDYLNPLIVSQATVVAQDATQLSYSTTVDVPAGRVAVGVAALATDHGDLVTINLGGDSQVLALRTTRIFNNTSLYFEDGVMFDVATAGTKTLTITSGTGSPQIHGVVVRAPDPVSGVVEEHGGHTHCQPVAAAYNGRLYMIHVEMYTGNRHVSINMKPWGKVFDAQSVNRNNNYHFGAAVCSHPKGVVFGMVGHDDPEIQLRFAPGGDMTRISGNTTVGGAGSELTYLHMTSLSKGDVMIMTRGDDNGTGLHALVYRVKGIDTPTPSQTVDVIFNVTGTSPYPRMLRRLTANDGKELLVGVWQARNGSSQWRGVLAAVFDPAANSGVGQWTSLDPSITGSASLGTAGSPRFTSSQADVNVSSTATHTGGGITLLNILAGGTRYTDGVIASVGNWPTRADVSCPFFDRAGSTDPNVYGTADIRWMTHNATVRTIVENYIISDVPDPNSYRIAVAMDWVGDNPADDKAYLLVSNRGTRAATNAYGEATDNYYDWGSGSTLELYLVSGVTTTTPAFKRLQTVHVVDGLTDGWCRVVEGLPNTFVFHSSVNELHPTHRQARTRVLQVEGYSLVMNDSFNGGDRAKLDAVFGKLPATGYLAGAAGTDGKTLLSDVDGITDVSLREAMLAYIGGKSTVVENGNGTKTITYNKQNGTTAKLTITFNSAGEFVSTSVG